jgi:hypothetical protein
MAKSPKPPLYPDITRQLRRIPIREVPDGMFAGPPGFKDIKVRCEACGCSYAPPWTDKLKFEQSHIQSADGAKWVLAGLPFACPSCGRENDLRFDSNTPSNGLVRLFGDESSERFGHHGYLYVYVVVAIHPEWIKAIHDKLAETKLRLRPSLPPSSWPLHLLEIRDTRWRKRAGVTLSIGEINAIVRDLAAFLGNYKEKRFISATIFPPFDLRHINSDKPELAIRDSTLTAALLSITEYLTRQGFDLEVVLEAQTDSHERQQIDYFVERIGRGLRYSLVFLYVCRGRLVGLPTTAPKGSSIEMEIADLVAYMVRRHFHNANIGRPSEFPLELLGEVFWGAFTGNGFGTHNAIGFPREHFYPELR